MVISFKWLFSLEFLFLVHFVCLPTGCSKKNTIPREVRFASLSVEDQVISSKGTYLQLCARCHGDRGEGKVGPSLIDTQWDSISGDPKEIARIIREGLIKKGMPPWGHILGDQEAMALAQWLLSMGPGKPVDKKQTNGEN